MRNKTHTVLCADDFNNPAPVAVTAEQYKRALCASMRDAVDKLCIPDLHAPVESVTITTRIGDSMHKVKLVPTSPGCTALEVQSEA